MLKTISAVLLAASVIASPALAAGSDKNTQAPAAKSAQVKQNTTQANAKAPTKRPMLHANANTSKHRVKNVRHHRSHQRADALRVHRLSKVSIKHTAPVNKRG